MMDGYGNEQVSGSQIKPRESVESKFSTASSGASGILRRKRELAIYSWFDVTALCPASTGPNKLYVTEAHSHAYYLARTQFFLGW